MASPSSNQFFADCSRLTVHFRFRVMAKAEAGRVLCKDLTLCLWWLTEVQPR